jgi:hypothetical protein
LKFAGNCSLGYESLFSSQGICPMSDTDSSGSLDAADSFTETTTTSWFSRILSSLMGVLFGLLLIIGTCVLLFWNEGRAVQTAKSLAEGSGLVVDVAPTAVDPAMQSKLIHVSGDARAQAPLVDPEFGVSTVALKLDRKVEMYQWKQEEHRETRKNIGGSEETTTTYTYTKVWSHEAIDSQKFRRASEHQNPPMRYNALSVVARDATIGAFRPGQPVLTKLTAQEAVRADAALLSSIKAKVRGPVQINDGQIYLGENASDPKLGDIRIDFHAAPNGPVSIVGQQTDTDFTPYQTKAGDRLLIVRSGNLSAAEMFRAEEQSNVVITWVLRVLGAGLMLLGFSLILAPLVVVADIVPLIGDVLGAGTFLVSLALTAVLAPSIIAIAWLFYRPLVSLAVLAVGIALGFGFRKWAAHRTAARARQVAPGPVPATAAS